jgi:predicted AAA+ superfamily ATPase
MSRLLRAMDVYAERFVDLELDALLPELPAMLLDGPKAVGKTATAQRRCVTVRRLDDRAAADVVRADPSVIAHDSPPTLIDEWQRVPEVWDAVRRLVDDRPVGGRFLLTGSAPLTGTHSGAGRIISVRMRPMCLAERLASQTTVSIAALLVAGDRPDIGGTSSLTLTDYVEEIMASGFPGVRALSERARVVALDGYLERIVDHDLAEAGFTVRRPAAVRAWLRACAAATATTASWERLRDSATAGVDSKPAKTTTIQYTELLTQLRVLDPLEAWSPGHNHLRRLAAAPKHHIADPALAVRLLQRSRTHLLRGDVRGVDVPNNGSLLGNLFESLASLTVRGGAQAAGAHVGHLRTRNGDHEVDFIVEGSEGVVAFEVKLGASVDDHDVRHLAWLRRQLGAELLDTVVINTGPTAYRRADGIAVVPLALLGA